MYIYTRTRVLYIYANKILIFYFRQSTFPIKKIKKRVLDIEGCSDNCYTCTLFESVIYLYKNDIAIEMYRLLFTLSDGRKREAQCM